MNIRKSKVYLAVALAALTIFSSCSKDDDDENNTGTDLEVLEGQITGTKKLDASKTYLLRGYVRVMAGGVLEIPAGTVIKGEKATKAALIIERDGDIIANGTANNPIVFTSDRPAGERNVGDWSGIIIAGKAPVNTADGTAQYEGGILGNDVAVYGGNVPADDSGDFTYVRIEFAGIAIDTDKEINGLTLCGVGSGTTVHHVQVSFGGDDSFEFFGGTVNAKYLVAYRGTDDDFDFDNGYNGKLQYGISIKDPQESDAAGTSRGIELENKGTVARDLYTRPVISNFTFLGPGTGASVEAQHGAGVHFGLNSKMVLVNSIIVNHRGNAVEFNTEYPAAQLSAGNSIFANNIVFGHTANYGVKDVTSYTASTLATFMGTKANISVTDLAGAGLTNTALNTPNLTLTANSVAKGKASFTGADLSTGFDQVTYVGAMETDNWTNGWVNWDPKNTTY